MVNIRDIPQTKITKISKANQSTALEFTLYLYLSIYLYTEKLSGLGAAEAYKLSHTALTVQHNSNNNHNNNNNNIYTFLAR